MLSSDLTCLLSNSREAVVPAHFTSTLPTGAATGTGKAVALGWKERTAASIAWEGKVVAINTASCVQQVENLGFFL